MLIRDVPVEEVFAMIFRARAFLAQSMASVRNGGFFRREELQYIPTLYHLLQMSACDDTVVSNGRTWTHHVTFQRQKEMT